MNRALVAIGFALLLLPSAHAAAAVARAVSFEEKVERADAIFRGRCIRTHSAFDPTGRWIVTYSTFAVDERYKGNSGHEVTLVTPGGKVGSLRQETIGVPSFTEGESSIIFVSSGDRGETVLFFDQGNYRLNRSERGEVMVAPASSELVLIDEAGAPAPRPAAETLSEFEGRLRELIGREGGVLWR